MRPNLPQVKKIKTALRFKQWMKRIFLPVVLCALVFPASAQNSLRLGINVNKVFSGTGVVGVGNPAAVIQGDKFAFRLGVNTSNNNLKVTGGNFEMRFYPAMEQTTTKIYFNVTSIMNYRTELKYTNAVHFNTGLQRDEVDLRACSASEHYAGFGLDVNVFGRFAIESSIGVGFFNIRNSDQVRFVAPAVMAKVGTSFYFWKRNPAMAKDKPKFQR